MKQFDAHKDIEAYRKLIELFPIGPLKMENVWQRDNMHYPRVINRLNFLIILTTSIRFSYIASKLCYLCSRNYGK